MIVVEGFAYIGTWLLLLYGKGVPTMQLMQFVYGVATSTEVAYYSYIYTKVNQQHFQVVTSWTRVALLLGRFLSGCLAQILTSSGLCDYRGLNYVSLVSVSLATLVSFLLPKVTKTIYFHHDEFSPVDNLENEALEGQSGQGTWIRAWTNVRRDFFESFGNLYILKWSVWWALGMCGNFQVGNYIQPLWETIQPVQGTDHIYNGAVEALTTLAGATLAFALGFVRLNWVLVGEPVLFVLSVLDGLLLLTIAVTDKIWVAYIGYFFFRACYQMLITVASYEIARHIRDDCYGLVFGFNTFLALLFQTILTMVVADDVGLALPPRTQFLVYGCFWIVIGAIFLIMFIRAMVNQSLFHEIQTQGLWIQREICSNSLEPNRREVPLGSTDPQ